MSSYHDYALTSEDVSAFWPLLANEELNCIGPQLHGTPPLAYLLVRARTPLQLPAGVMPADPGTAQAVLGVWA